MNSAPKWYDGHLREFQGTAHIRSVTEYQDLYRNSLIHPDVFWSKQARDYVSWEKEWDSVLRSDPEEARFEWFGGGILNASYNCLDRHLGKLKDKIAYRWEAREPGCARHVTYEELFHSVNTFAALLRRYDLRKGDRIVMYMPLVPELVVAMLAASRIGAVHCVVSPEYGVDSLAGRIQDCGAKAVITADAGFRKGNRFPLKKTVDRALGSCPPVNTVIVLDRYGTHPDLVPNRDVRWQEAISDSSLPSYVSPEPMGAEDPLFIVHASPAIGRPRALVHTHGGYLLFAAMTAKLIFDLHEHDVFWSTAELGHITGHSFSVYGPLVNGMTSVLFEGEPGFPDHSRYWQVIADNRVSKFCCSPSMLRASAAYGHEHIDRHDLSSLEVLGSAGDRLDAEMWEWLYHRVGKARCPIMDTWWQAETGGPMMSALPGVAALKPGSVSFPFFGVSPVILDLNTGEETKFPNQEGAFFIGKPWPGMARTVFGDHEAFKEAYFDPFPGMFITGAGALKDSEGYYWITGRIDDVINVAENTIGAWELEGALAAHQGVAEATAVGFPHKIKGHGIYAFVILNSRVERSETLKKELADLVVDRIGSMAEPDVIQWADALPKTRGGKILRRVLQKIAAGETEALGDLSTVANPGVIEALVRDRVDIAPRG
ncbi:MAG TPA: acetate--CoA ligase [Desulfomonilaceae bacterium]|nr:acetate--CoA ligase [Desulfomonilaceae bacterium]